MSRKRHAFSLQSLVKKSSLTGLILFFAWILFNLSAHFAQSQQPVILPSSDAPAKIYSNQAGDDLRRLFVDAIKQAHSSITLLIYSLTDSAIIEALLEKSEGYHRGPPNEIRPLTCSGLFDEYAKTLLS